MGVMELIIVTAAISLFSIGGIYLLYIKTRRKKITYRARVYALGEGVKPPVTDENGVILSDMKLQDLKPWTTDVLEVVEKKPGIKIFRLQKFGNVTPPVDSADLFENFGQVKEVNVLHSEGSCTLLKSGYDSKAGKIFRPIPVATMNMVKSEIAIRKERLQSNKDILEKVMPAIMLSLMIFGILGVAYFHGRAVIESSKEFSSSATILKQISDQNVKMSDNNLRAAVVIAQALSGKEIEKYINNEGNEISNTDEKPPSIE